MNEKQIAHSVIQQMDIEPRFFAEATLNLLERDIRKGDPRFDEIVTKDLCRRLAEEIFKQNIPLYSEREEEKVYKNVPQPTGNVHKRAELIVFNPNSFAEFITQFADEVKKQYIYL